MTWENEYQRAVSAGWMPAFHDAATQWGWPVAVLLAIASRETRMGGPRLPDGRFKWVVQPGDGGHGHGLMQIDDRAHPAFCSTPALWQNPGLSIRKGAHILSDWRAWLSRRQGIKVPVPGKSTGVYRIDPFPAPSDLDRCAIAMYNCGGWAPYHRSQGRGVDWGTTGKNYSSDILSRAAGFQLLLNADNPLTLLNALSTEDL